MYLGVAETPAVYSSPGPLPNHAVDVKLQGELLEDIRQRGSDGQAWRFTVEIGPYADFDGEGYNPVLAWNANDLPEGIIKLIHGHAFDGDILVDDMSVIEFYQTSQAEGEYVLPYTIIFEPDPDDIYQSNKGYSDDKLFNLCSPEYMPYWRRQIFWPFNSVIQSPYYQNGFSGYPLWDWYYYHNYNNYNNPMTNMNSHLWTIISDFLFQSPIEDLW